MNAGRHIDAWVDTVRPEDAEGTLRRAYDWQAARIGEPAEYTRLGSLHPELVEERLRLYKVISAVQSSLTDVEKEIVVYLTSTLNQTPHCASGAYAKLQTLAVPDDLLDRIVANPEAAQTGSARLDEILRYTAILALAPGRLTEADIAALRAVGLDDAAIVALNNLAAYFAYTNRVATGLGLKTRIPTQHAHKAVPE